LTGKRINADEALAIGLVDAVTGDADLRVTAIRLANEIAENAPLAVQSVRATMRKGLAYEVAQATDHELSEQQWLRATDDAYEGIQAVSERRASNFKGK
jgi:enoyl-CoA hydratase/carnithine racemase